MRYDDINPNSHERDDVQFLIVQVKLYFHVLVFLIATTIRLGRYLPRYLLSIKPV